MYIYKYLLYVQLDTYVSDKRQTFIFRLVAYEMVNIIACKTFRNLMIKNMLGVNVDLKIACYDTIGVLSTFLFEKSTTINQNSRPGANWTRVFFLVPVYDVCFLRTNLIRRSKRQETVRNINTIPKEVTVWNIIYKYIFHDNILRKTESTY